MKKLEITNFVKEAEESLAIMEQFSEIHRNRYDLDGDPSFNKMQDAKNRYLKVKESANLLFPKHPLLLSLDQKYEKIRDLCEQILERYFRGAT